MTTSKRACGWPVPCMNSPRATDRSARWPNELLQLLQQPDAQPRTALRAKALETAANLISWEGDLAQARALAEDSLGDLSRIGRRAPAKRTASIRWAPSCA